MTLMELFHEIDAHLLQDESPSEYLRKAALMGLCDRIGRGNADVEKEQESIRQFLKICGAKEDGF